MVAQARALALNAQKLAAKLNKKPTGLNMLIHNEKEELPLGDIQQRKLIEEAKLGQKLKQDLLPVATINPLAGSFVDVKTKFEGFIQEQQQKFEESLSQFDIVKGGHHGPSRSANISPTRLTRLSEIQHGESVDQQEKQQVDDAGSVDTNAGLVSDKNEKPLLSAIVFKRRSGYGKYSAKHAWERRRMDLVGTTIRYFNLLDTHKDNKEIDKDAQSDGNIVNSSATEVMPSNMSDSFSRAVSSFDTTTEAKQKKGLWEQAKENITKTTETFTTNLIQTVDRNGPRGSINLIKENAVVAATCAARAETYSNSMSINMGSMGNVFSSVPPTPFGISVIVKNEAKWKLCFETQIEQMQWLTTLTEIIVRSNVENYNEELTKSRRGAARNIQSVQSESTANADNAEEAFRSPPGEEGDALWQYSTAATLSRSEHSQSGEQQELSIDDISTVDRERVVVDTTKILAQTPLSVFHQIVNNGSVTGPSVSLKRRNVIIVSATMNFAFKVVFSSKSTCAFFFYTLLANVVFWILVVDENLKGQDNQRVSFLTSIIEAHFFPTLDGETSSKSTTVNNADSSAKTKDFKPKLEAPRIKEGFKPIAGSTTKRVMDESDSDECNGESFIRWCVLPAEKVQVRSHGYLKTKKKIPSPSSLYEAIGCDVLNSGKRVTDFACKVELPKIEFQGDVGERTWKSPDVFVISLSVPTEEPSLTRPTTDGEAVSLTVYYKMKKETRDILRKVTASDYDPSSPIEEEQNETDLQRRVVNSVKLWEEWCRTSPHDEKMQARFKFIPNVHNPTEVGLPSYIAKYCGKPVLIKRANATGFLSDYSHLNAMEFGISLHPFPYLAKKAMAYMKWAVFPKALLSLSYVIEGRSDDELPEALIGDSVQLFYPNYEAACECNAFLAGTSKSSVISIDNDQNPKNDGNEDGEVTGEEGSSADAILITSED